MKQIKLDEIKPHDDPDRIYTFRLRTNTKTDYDGNQIEWSDMVDLLDLG